MDEMAHNASLPNVGISEEMAEELCIDRAENELLYEEFCKSHKGKDDA